MLYALLTSRAGRESNRLSTTLYQRWPYQLPSPPTSAWTKYYFHSHDRSNAQVGIIAGNYGTTPFSIGFGLHFFPKAFFFSWWKSRQNVWMKSDISKSCQIIALLNVNTVIWQVFELVKNRSVLTSFSPSCGGSFKRTTVARGWMGEQLSGLGSILNNQSSRDSYRCCPSKMPGATPVKWTSTVAMVVEVRSKEGMKVDEGKHRRAGNRNLFINEIFCTKAPV